MVRRRPQQVERANYQYLKHQWDFSESGIAYLQTICIPTAKATASDCVSITSTIAATVSTGSYSALGLKAKSGETSIFKSSQDKVSQLYGSQHVIDFVVCFGFANINSNSGRPDTEIPLNSFKRASQALLNVFIMNYGVQTNNLRVSLFNYLDLNGQQKLERPPMFLRIIGYIASSTYSALNIFIDNRIELKVAQNCISSAPITTCKSYGDDNLFLT